MYGCYKKRNGQLRVVENPDECRPSEVAIALGQNGQPGGIDLSDTYVRICENTGDCYCADGSKVLHGYVECPLEAVLVSAGTPFDGTDDGFHAMCMYLDGTYVDPAYIAIRCPGTSSSEDCTDGIDNDEDGLTDCDDPDCDNAPACQEPPPPPPPAEDCTDGIDNDEDGLTDCDDPDCRDVPACAEPNLEKEPILTEICSDGIDNDGDGKIDCKDKKDCRKDPACSKKKKS